MPALVATMAPEWRRPLLLRLVLRVFGYNTHPYTQCPAHLGIKSLSLSLSDLGTRENENRDYKRGEGEAENKNNKTNKQNTNTAYAIKCQTE